MPTTSSPNAEERRQFATSVVARLRAEGFEALWAGGCVRDITLSLTPSDYDVATDARPDQVMALFRNRTVPVGESFGVVRVRGPHGSGLEVEVATFRSDGAYVDGRRPESVVFSSPQLDAQRRDFTINGMFFDPFSGHVIDYVGGLNDLRDRVVRAIGDASARFREDKLRLVRAVRFAARFGFRLEPATRAALVAMASSINVVAAERVAQELRRMLVHESRALAMDLMLRTGLMTAIMPQAARMKGIFQGKPVQPEGDLWDHTLLVLKLLPHDPSFPLAFAALLHDVGKPGARAFQNGRFTFHNHERVGREIALAISRQLKLSNAERDRVAWLVEHHQYLGDAKRLRESKLKRILSEPGIDELLELHRADALASYGEAPHVDYCEYYLKTQPSGPINPPPLLTGHDLTRHGLAPGPRFTAILDAVREAQLDGLLSGKREALEWIDKRIEEWGSSSEESA
jgi:poly(A) polymerase